uniref:Uncharacterized protein n=1 Tax=Panagrolaimus davidi TaxID=227884 RepID=A0A914PQ21_9BILA
MYQIQPLKNQFDTFLSEMSFTDANIYKLFETLEIYKFEKLKVSLGNYLVGNWRTLFERDDFLKANKNVFLGILELDRHRNQNIENSLFLKQKLIKEEMSEFLPKFKFNFRSVPFLNDVVAEKRYLFDDWNEILENARNSRDFIDDDDIKFFVKFQILPKDFNGRYHQVLRGFVYAESYEPLNKMVELIQTFHLENGAYKNRTPSNASLELASYLEYFDDSTQYIFGVNRHCGGFAVINADCFENNDYYEYKKLCYLEGNNFPAFEEEEENFFVQFL